MNKLLLIFQKSNKNKSVGLLSLMLMLLFSLSTVAQNTITSFSPSVVTTRSVVRINGTGFTAATIVRFGTTQVTKSSVSSTLITVLVTGPFTAGDLTVTTNSITANGGPISYVAVVAPPAVANATRLITDYNGYYSSTATTTNTANQPDTRHNMLGFGYGGTVYTTGANDGIINANLAAGSYTLGNFRALPLVNLTGSVGTDTYLAMGLRIDGSATTSNFSAPGIAGLTAKDNLIDGLKGLDIGTGVTNIASDAVIEYSVESINTTAINDAQPDIIISQIAMPTTGVADFFIFVDANGNIVGNPISGTFPNNSAIGTYRLDLFSLGSGTLSTATVAGFNPAGSPPVRDIWLSGLKLSDFGITSANASSVVKFLVLPGGTSDPAFFAYNENAINTGAPVISQEPANQVVCTGDSATFSVVASGGSLTYQWKRNGINIAGATANSYTVTSVSAANVGAYSVVVSNSNGSVVSNTVYLNSLIVTNPIAPTGSVCLGSTVNLTVEAQGNNPSYQWFVTSSNDNTSGTAVSAGGTGATYTVPTGATGTLYYYARVYSNGQLCTANPTTQAAVTVSPTSVAGSASASQTAICSGSNVTLSLTGFTGSIVWQSSATPTGSYTNVSTGTGFTTANYTTAALTSNRSYRAVVTSGSCSSATSNVVTITISPASVGGTVASNQTVCSGSPAANLLLSGNTGTVQSWQRSATSDFAINTTINNITNTLTSAEIGSITSTTYFRAVVKSGTCASAFSSAAVISVSPATVPGTISSNQIICAGSPVANLVLSGNTGNVTSWQSSATSDFAVTTTINNTTNTLTSAQIGLLTETTYFRAVVQSGNCPAAFSSAAIITVNPTSVGGTVSGDQTVCLNSTAAAITLSGNVGNVISWQRSATADFASPMTIANTTNILSVAEIGAVTGTTYFRAVVQSGLCPVAFSTVATVGTASTTWNGTSWSNGTPTSSTAAIFTGNFSSTANIDACSVYVDANAVVKINSGNRVSIYGAITVVTGSFTLEDNANLLQQTAVTNSGNIIVKRTTTTPLKRLDYVLWSSPVIGQNLFSFSPATLANRFYTYNPASNLYVVVTTPPATTNFETGKGYLIRTPNTFSDTTPSPLTLAFTGEPRNGDVSVPVAAGLYNAIGNPYPSAINADSFINTNLITEPLYFWRKVNNTVTSSYATYTFAGGTGTESNTGGLSALTPTGIIQAGQGFITIAPTSAVTFNNSMRTNSAGPFFRTSEIERNRIWLNLTNTEGAFSQTMVAYMTGGSSAIDTNLDGLYINDSETALTTVIEGAEYAIQARALPFVATDVVPVGFKATTAGTYTIGLDSVDGLFTDANQPIYLKDNLAGTEQNLRNGNYTFSTEGGVSNSRFEIVYTASLATVDQKFNANSVVVYKQNQQIFINTGKANMKNVKVYDVRGRLLVEKNNINSNETSVNAGETNQVLIVKITSDGNVVVSKKVVN